MASQEIQDVIAMMRSRPLPDPPPSLEERRAGLEAMMTATPLPDDVRTEPVNAGGVPAEWISTPESDERRAVLYLHGGGYVLGSIATHRELASRVARSSKARILLIDYRLAPEHPFPAAVDDATAAYRWLLAQGYEPTRLAIAGDSAGGGLTMATLLALKDAGDPLPAAGVVLSPWVDLEQLGESMTSRAEMDPMIQRAALGEMASQYVGDGDVRTPYCSPLHGDLAGLPPLLIQVGTAETLYDDSARLAEKAHAAGVEVTLEPWEDMIHVFQMFGQAPEAREATERIGEFIAKTTA